MSESRGTLGTVVMLVGVCAVVVATIEIVLTLVVRPDPPLYTVSLAIAGVLAAAGLVLLLAKPRRKTPVDPPEPARTPAPPGVMAPVVPPDAAVGRGWLKASDLAHTTSRVDESDLH